jgi:hypothetical protein
MSTKVAASNFSELQRAGPRRVARDIETTLWIIAGMRKTLVLLLFAMACAEARPRPAVVPATPVRSPDPFIEAPKAYAFDAGGRHFTLDHSGRFTCGGAASFSMDLSDAPFVESLQFVPYGDEVLVLLYELSDGEGGYSRMSRIYVPDCELVFTTDLPAFNLAPAVLEESSLYVAGHGFIGKFDLEYWGYDWTHGNLYHRGRFNAFEAPEVYADRVVFREITHTKDAPRDIVVQKRSGGMEIRAAGR